VLILLPPSEGKADAGAGRRLNLDTMSLPDLRPAREAVLDALVAACERDPAGAAAALGLSTGQFDEVERNTRLRAAKTLPAGRLYTGVLYDALDLASLGADAYAMLKRSIVIFSGLWGALRLDDRVPPYRCAMGATVPGIGPLGAYWREALAEPLGRLAGRRLVLDLRSSAYAAAWAPRGPVAERTVALRVLHERVVDGAAVRSVVSHFNKATKGRLVRDLAVAGARPATPGELITALRDLKYTVEEQPAVAGRVRRLDLVVGEL
jgi:cytoplasmic iron level regulating protein YaaA (DUF328/UPF0246 family)